ncbi:MAG TPA: hypothetical protein P5557_08035 [Candidatus Sumerlaeia bacterium]|nr:MAG: hypothetical protein BWY12_00202 [candidate division BRC1 bacterium ADurb.Bin183]HRR31238.1 hypothetical protein [Candidatus Sumerlaeia bacterium]HRU54076.1 hypothetical protein [Candidatus Sumerlaeia bacterium]
MNRKRQIYIGDYVRFKDEYLSQWRTEKSARLAALRETIFIVVESCRCYNWLFGIGGSGMLLTLRPFLGPLLEEQNEISRGEDSLEIVPPALVNELMETRIESEMDIPQ